MRIRPEILNLTEAKTEPDSLKAEGLVSNARVKAAYELNDNQWHSAEGAFALVDDRVKVAFDSKVRPAEYLEQKAPEVQRAGEQRVGSRPAAPLDLALPLEKFLQDFSSPLADSYRRSHALPPGADGKSPALERLVDHLRAVPWAGQLQVKISDSVSACQYDPKTSTLTLKRRENPLLATEEAAREIYHAGHQHLGALYGKGMLNKEDYVQIKIYEEVDGFLAQMAVREECSKGKTPPVSYDTPTFFGGPKTTNLEELRAHAGREGLFKFLCTARPAEGAEEPLYLRHSKNFGQYSAHFDRDKEIATAMLKQWRQSGGLEEI